MSEMLVITPSRGRPHNIERLARTIKETVAGPVDLLVCLDDDDEHNYPRLGGVQYMVGPRIKLTAWWNLAASERAPDYEYFGLLGDDVVPETEGWDVILTDELAGLPFGIAYGDDGIQHENLPTHPVLPSRMVTDLGWVALPTTKHLYLDSVWKVLAEATGTLRYRDDVKLTHYHRNIGLAPADATYWEANDSPQAQEDREAFFSWYESPDFERTAATLRSL